MAELLAGGLPLFAPHTNLYGGGSGLPIWVTRSGGDVPVPAVALPLTGFLQGHVGDTAPMPTEVFLCDENARLVDADGDPTNGMTALLRLAGGTTFDDAVRSAEQHLT